MTIAKQIFEKNKGSRKKMNGMGRGGQLRVQKGPESPRVEKEKES